MAGKLVTQVSFAAKRTDGGRFSWASQQGCSSIGRAPVSKTGGCEFDSRRRLYAVWTGFPTAVQDLFGSATRYIVPTILLVGGLWASFRAINYPKFADFLIAVEAEMNKVSWPSRGELVRASLVVIFVILALAMLLYFYDILWMTIFTKLGVLRGATG